jgi:hypothetical protein
MLFMVFYLRGFFWSGVLMNKLKISISLLIVFFATQGYAQNFLSKTSKERKKLCQDYGYTKKDLHLCTKYWNDNCGLEGQNKRIDTLVACSKEKDHIEQAGNQTSRSHYKEPVPSAPTPAVGAPSGAQVK